MSLFATFFLFHCDLYKKTVSYNRTHLIMGDIIKSGLLVIVLLAILVVASIELGDQSSTKLDPTTEAIYDNKPTEEKIENKENIGIPLSPN